MEKIKSKNYQNFKLPLEDIFGGYDIEKYKPLLKSIAYKFKNSGEPLEDLERVGYIGLINAINLYNQNLGIKFITYATWFISGEIRHYIRDKHQEIKIPSWMKKLNKKIDEFIISYKKENNKFPSLSEISEKFNLTEEGIKEILKAMVFPDQEPKLEKIKDLSIINIFKSGFTPESSGRDAAIEYKQNEAKKKH